MSFTDYCIFLTSNKTAILVYAWENYYFGATSWKKLNCDQILTGYKILNLTLVSIGNSQ